MTETADPTTLSVDERTASARGFFDLEPAGSTTGSDTFLPPPPPAYPTATMPATAIALAPAGVPQLPRLAPTQPRDFLDEKLRCACAGALRESVVAKLTC